MINNRVKLPNYFVSKKYNRKFEVEINNNVFPALIGSGSDISLVRLDVFKQLGKLNFVRKNALLLQVLDPDRNCR